MESALPFCTERETAFDQLHDPLNGQILWNRDEQVEMLRHNHEFVNQNAALALPDQYADEQRSHPVAL
jgi:hypothetical protein